jgi:hypothetical protein
LLFRWALASLQNFCFLPAGRPLVSQRGAGRKAILPA